MVANGKCKLVTIKAAWKSLDSINPVKHFHPFDNSREKPQKCPSSPLPCSLWSPSSPWAKKWWPPIRPMPSLTAASKMPPGQSLHSWTSQSPMGFSHSTGPVELQLVARMRANRNSRQPLRANCSTQVRSGWSHALAANTYWTMRFASTNAWRSPTNALAARLQKRKDLIQKIIEKFILFSVWPCQSTTNARSVPRTMLICPRRHSTTWSQRVAPLALPRMPKLHTSTVLE